MVVNKRKDDSLQHQDKVAETNVIKAFHKSAGISIDEVIGDFFQPILQGLDEIIKTSQIATLDTLDPIVELAFGAAF